ncbi:LysR family transcriptional regulator [Taklimakanibacter lacteus]|uniref:LysR family transcriptional regulator n=1 Tax=Taklimakanibacter lacteus TaxID=2268456 RepID=UPI0013C491F9
MYEWSDLRIFLAVVRAGSTLGAARGLGMNQTTVSRRIQVLEHQLGLALFARRSTGYALTEHGRTLEAAASRMETAALDFECEAERLRRLVSGLIRVTAPETMFTHLLAPIVAAYRQEHPRVQIEQVSSEAHCDLEKGEADIAFRATESPISESLIGQRLPDFGWTLYCSPIYAGKHGMPASPEEIRGHSVIVYEKALGQTARGRWLVTQADPQLIVARSNTVMNMVGLLKASLGVGLLPCIEGDNAGLLRCFEPRSELGGMWWLLMTPEVQRMPEARRFAEFAVVRLRGQRRLLRGERI